MMSPDALDRLQEFDAIYLGAVGAPEVRRAAPVLVAAAPSSPSPSQQATLDLLVNRKLGIQ